MKAKTFILKWKEKGNWKEKEIERDKFIAIMSGIKVGFDDNNTVSTNLLEIGKEVTLLKIDKDRNSSREVPFIVYNIDDKEEIVYEISGRHQIMWTILNGLCY